MTQILEKAQGYTLIHDIRYLHWSCFTIDHALQLKMHYHWSCVTIDHALQLKMHYHWSCITDYLKKKLYVCGLISFASTVIFLFTLDISGYKPFLCSRMVSLFHHTSPWTHRCLQSSPSAHRNGIVFRRSVQTACCYWILNCGKSSFNWNSQTNASRLWWSVCWCEYSKTLGKVVQRWRIGASRFEWQIT